MNVSLPKWRRGRRWTIVAVLAAVLLAGCGNDDEPAATVVQTQTVTVDSNPLANLPESPLNETDLEYLRDLDALATDLEEALPTLDAKRVATARDRIASAVGSAESDVYSIGDGLIAAATLGVSAINDGDPLLIGESAERLRSTQGTIAAQLAKAP